MIKILEVNFCENKNGSKTIGFYRFSWFFHVFKKSVIRRGGFQKLKISDVPILYIISTLRRNRLSESYLRIREFN